MSAQIFKWRILSSTRTSASSKCTVNLHSFVLKKPRNGDFLVSVSSVHEGFQFLTYIYYPKDKRGCIIFLSREKQNKILRYKS
jgi:hypothetical protein